MQSRDRKLSGPASHAAPSRRQSTASAATELAARMSQAQSQVGNRAIARALPQMHLALSQVGNRGIARVLQTQTSAHHPGQPLQRQVRTIGNAIDAEVRLGKQTLIEDTGLTDGGSFEDVKELISGEQEVLVGHGNETGIGGFDAQAMTDAMKTKIKPEQEYNVTFFACNTGLTPNRQATDIEQPRALSTKVQSALKDAGYKVTISAPKGILLILAKRRYLITGKYPKPTKNYPGKKTLADVKAKVMADLEALAGVTGEKQPEKDWQTDVTQLKNRGWIPKVQKPQAQTWFQYFQEKVEARRGEIASLDTAPANRRKAVEKLEKTHAAILAFKAKDHAEGITPATVFKKFLEDVEQTTTTKRMGKLVDQRQDAGDRFTSDLGGTLDESSWQRDA